MQQGRIGQSSREVNSTVKITACLPIRTQKLHCVGFGMVRETLTVPEILQW